MEEVKYFQPVPLFWLLPSSSPILEIHEFLSFWGFFSVTRLVLSSPHYDLNLFSPICFEKQPLWSPLLFSLSWVCVSSRMVVLVKFWKECEYAQSTIFLPRSFLLHWDFRFCFNLSCRQTFPGLYFSVPKWSSCLAGLSNTAIILGSPLSTICLEDPLCLSMLNSCFFNLTSSSFLVRDRFYELPEKNAWEIRLLVLCIWKMSTSHLFDILFNDRILGWKSFSLRILKALL